MCGFGAAWYMDHVDGSKEVLSAYEYNIAKAGDIMQSPLSAGLMSSIFS
jgi:hypothetical protein